MPQNSKKISIIIRVKNEARWIKVLLKELKNQSFKDYEIIFCNNESTDNTLEILKYNKIKKIINLKNYKPGFALNKSVLKAKSKYVVFLSCHCIPTDVSWLENFYNYMEQNEHISAAYGKQIPLPGSNSQNSLDLSILFRDEEVVHEKDPYISNANSIYRTRIIKKYKFNSSLTNVEDRVWANEEVKRGGKIAYISKSSVFHLHGIHQHSSSTDRSVSTIKIIGKKIKSIWNKCFFLKAEYFTYSILINARREKNIKILKKKIRELKSSSILKKLNIKKIIVITDLNIPNTNKIHRVKPSNTLSDDLVIIYKRFKKLWVFNDYLIALNATQKWEYLKIIQLIKETIYLSKASGTFYEEYNGNFIVEFPNNSKIKSIDLVKRVEKPKLKLLQWARGCIFEPRYLSKGKYIDEDTYLFRRGASTFVSRLKKI